MTTPLEEYAAHLSRWADHEASVNHLITDPSAHPPAFTFTYRNLLRDGSITGFTYGLSSVRHPQWRLGCPELCVDMRSTEPNWVMALGVIVKQLRGKRVFQYGEVVRIDPPISPKESGMSAFLLYAPSFMDQEFTRVELPDRVVNLVQAYPLFESEIPRLAEIGPFEFLTQEGVDFGDPTRPPAV